MNDLFGVTKVWCVEAWPVQGAGVLGSVDECMLAYHMPLAIGD